MNQSGFTSKELIMVVAVIAILCLAAIPQFFAMQNMRRENELKKITETPQTQVTKDKEPNDNIP